LSGSDGTRTRDLRRDRWLVGADLPLLPSRTDHWWWVQPGRPTEPVAREVVAAIRDHVLSEKERHMPERVVPSGVRTARWASVPE
jgi:hypothetical protein